MNETEEAPLVLEFGASEGDLARYVRLDLFDLMVRLTDSLIADLEAESVGSPGAESLTLIAQAQGLVAQALQEIKDLEQEQ